MKQITAVLILAFTMFSCNQAAINTKNNSVKAPIDSLVTNWENNWNKNDSTGVRNMFIADALLVDDNLVAVNAAEFSDKWIHPNINLISNLKSIKLQEWSEDSRANYTGKYTLDVIMKDSVVAKPEGVYTVNWLKTEKGDWKITSAIIHSFKK